ncbi:nucleotide exchange factor GrpE [Candidatus Woesearchaeota archaeon]|nr:nucleotide exchange factor GrpE [Candidatus Woesearchaeota archaeon]MBT5739531.1 nucleotide exchange factor GrpE [Candidatus Woesearchaeota archaeon]
MVDLKSTKKGKKAEKESAKDLLQEVTELLKRTQANFENYRKQTEKRTSELQEMASKNILVQLLPIIDNLDLALKNVDQNPEQIVEGVKLIRSQMDNLLQDNHVEKINTEDKQFDPYFHEALMKVPSEKTENTIIEEFQHGYILHGKLIRHAKVKVSAGKEKKTKIEKQPTEDN